MGWKDDRIGSAVIGENPTVLVKMKSGFAVLGDAQFLPGYCVLLGYPKVSCLNDLNIGQRSAFLLDMGIIGDVITAVCKPSRINYAIMGNLDAYLHAHVTPRYGWEDESRKKLPAWFYPDEYWRNQEYQFDERKHVELRTQLSGKLEELMQEAYR